METREHVRELARSVHVTGEVKHHLGTQVREQPPDVIDILEVRLPPTDTIDGIRRVAPRRRMDLRTRSAQRGAQTRAEESAGTGNECLGNAGHEAWCPNVSLAETALSVAGQRRDFRSVRCL